MVGTVTEGLGTIVYSNDLSQSTSTFSALPTPVASYTGQQRIVSDLNNAVFVDNGTAWKPVSNSFVLTSSLDSTGIAPSGTINTGASANITLGTALDRTYAQGIYLYLPTIATTPAITAGFYWIVMSSTTVGTVYASKGGAAINFTVGASYTGVTTRVECFTTSILAGLLGTNGIITVDYSATITNNANNKIYGFAFGSATGLCANANTSITGYCGAKFIMQNRADAGHQAYTSNPMVATVTQGKPTFIAVDTAAAQNLSLGVTLSTATDYYIFQSYTVTVTLP